MILFEKACWFTDRNPQSAREFLTFYLKDAARMADKLGYGIKAQTYRTLQKLLD